MAYKLVPAAFLVIVLSACAGEGGGSSSVLAPVAHGPLPVANATPPSYTISALPLQARAINNNGVVVGAADGKAAKFANGTLTIFPAHAGTEGSDAYDVNDLGEAVGYDTTGVQQGATCVLTAYFAVYHTDGTVTFSAGRPYPYAALDGINDSGTATGNFGADAIAFPPLTTVFSPAAGGTAIGKAINGSGVIVGEYIVDSVDVKPFTVPAQPNCCGTANFGSADDINTLGHIVGFSYSTDPNADTPWLYANAATTVLANLPGETSGAARAINDNDEVVGLEFGTSGPGHGVLWKNGQVYDLQTLVTNMPAGAQIEDAMDINNSGQILVFVPSVGSQTFLLTPK